MSETVNPSMLRKCFIFDDEVMTQLTYSIPSFSDKEAAYLRISLLYIRHHICTLFSIAFYKMNII